MRHEDGQDQAQEGQCNFLHPSYTICPFYVAQDEGQEEAQDSQEEAQEGQEQAQESQEEATRGAV